MAPRLASSAAIEANRYMSFTVLGFVAAVVSLIDNLGVTVSRLSNKSGSIPLWKKYDIIVSFNSENGIKVIKLARDFDIPTMKFTTALKNKDKILPD